jgi:preprotein translocase subunit SecE
MEQIKSFPDKIKTGLNQLGAYLGEVLVEFKRITWPGRQELKESTGVVITFIIILAVVIFVCDKVIRHVLGVLHGM